LSEQTPQPNKNIFPSDPCFIYRTQIRRNGYALRSKTIRSLVLNEIGKEEVCWKKIVLLVWYLYLGLHFFLVSVHPLFSEASFPGVQLPPNPWAPLPFHPILCLEMAGFGFVCCLLFVLGFGFSWGLFVIVWGGIHTSRFRKDARAICVLQIAGTRA
jgi:hypothetical protein